MTCQHIIVHRLKNLKPPQRYEPCCKPAGLRRIEGHTGPQKVWLCRVHWSLFKRPRRRSSSGDDLLSNLPDVT
jgi:hypothetical protein